MTKNATNAINTTHIEILVLSILACLLASTFAVVPVWIGVIIAYVAFLKAFGITRFVAVSQRKGYTLLSFNIAPGTSLCLVMRNPQPQPIYNVWQLQMKEVAA